MEFREKLKEYLLDTFPTASTASGGSHIVMRCPLCGDSRDPKSKHLYIALPTETIPPLYYCHKCTSFGLLTAKVLRMMTSYNDGGMGIELEQFNREFCKMPKNHILKDRLTYQIYNSYISDNDLSKAKLFYINKRLGQNLTYKDLMNNKIILNIYDLLNANNVKEYTRYESPMHDLNESFIGFISMDNAFVNMRNLREGKVNYTVDHKYVNYSIFDKPDNSRRFYVLPGTVNMTDPMPIKINIGEGGFDILSVFFNLKGQDKYQNVYASIGGKAYLNIIKLFVQDIGIINCEFHIYIDNDIDDYVIYNMQEVIYPLGISLYIHRNMFPGEKDFGVPLDRIKEQITKL